MKFKVGTKVSADVNGDGSAFVAGKIVGGSARKTTIKPDNGGKDISVYTKYVTEQKKNVLIDPDMDRYTTTSEIPTTSGRPSVDIADEVAQLLRGKSLKEVYSIAAQKTDESVAKLKAKYGHLNPGMQRMNLGNRIRGALGG